MRLNSAAVALEQSGTVQVARATIKATPKIFDFFANQTYANKPVAILRELVANGVDAHVAAGKPTLPVEVYLPSELDPMFKVKDFGTGMSHDFVMNDFMRYTDGSTKDNSDNFIGGFGIGSKSPFAYTDQFTLRIVHGGVLSVYTMFKDTDGVPAIGLQAQKTTDEPNGVEISFPVETKDIATFLEATQKALQYFNPLPVIHGGESVLPPKYTYRGTNWGLRETSGELGIVMGGVRYPVNKDNLSYELRQSKLGPLLDYGIDITLPIGSASIALSREALSYDTSTTDAIKKALEAIIDEVVATFAVFFDKAPNEWEAMKLLGKEVGLNRYGGYNYYSGGQSGTARKQLLAANAKYKGQKLETGIHFEREWGPIDKNTGKRTRVPDKFEIWYVERSRAWNSDKVSDPKWRSPPDHGYVYPAQVNLVLIDDTALSDVAKIKPIARIKHYVKENHPDGNVVYVFRPNRIDGGKISDIVTALKGITDYKLVSTLPEPPKNVTATGKTIRPRIRMWTYDGSQQKSVYGGDGGHPSSLREGHLKRGIQEIAYKDQPTKGTMVVMDNFKLPDDFHKKMKAGVLSYKSLHYVNRADWEKIKNDGGWVDWTVVWEENLKKALADPKNKDIGVTGLYLDDDDLDDYFTAFGGRAKPVIARLTAAQRKTAFGKIVEVYERFQSGLTPEQKALVPFVEKADYLPGMKPKELASAMKRQLPEADYYLRHQMNYGVNESHYRILLRLI